MKRPHWLGAHNLRLDDEWGEYVSTAPDAGYLTPPWRWDTIILAEARKLKPGQWMTIEIHGAVIAVQFDKKSIYGGQDEWYAETEVFYQYGISALDAILGVLGKHIEIIGDRNQ